MSIIGEDEHYIYEMISSNEKTCTIRRTEKPKKEILWRHFDDWKYQFFVKTYSERKDDIIEVMFRNKEAPRIEWTYDYQKKELSDRFIQEIKEWYDDEWSEEFFKDFFHNLQEYIELTIDMFRDVEWTIKKLKENIKANENLLSFLKLYHLEDDNEIEDELKRSYELLQKLELLSANQNKNDWTWKAIWWASQIKIWKQAIEERKQNIEVRSQKIERFDWFWW